MFVISFKAATAKILAAGFVCIAISALAVSLMPEAGYAMNVNKIVSEKDISLKNISTEKQKVELLSALGFEVDPVPVQDGSVSVPKKFDAVLTQYNALMKKQGFNLEKYKGKTVQRTTYAVLNENGVQRDKNTCFVTLILYRDKVVGADVCYPKEQKYKEAITTDNA